MPQPSACACKLLQSCNLLLNVDLTWHAQLWFLALQGKERLLLCREKKDSLAESLVQSSSFDVERRGERLAQDQILSCMVIALQHVSSGAPGELSMGRSVSDQQQFAILQVRFQMRACFIKVYKILIRLVQHDLSRLLLRLRCHLCLDNDVKRPVLQPSDTHAHIAACIA